MHFLNSFFRQLQVTLGDELTKQSTLNSLNCIMLNKLTCNLDFNVPFDHCLCVVATAVGFIWLYLALLFLLWSSDSFRMLQWKTCTRVLTKIKFLLKHYQLSSVTVFKSKTKTIMVSCTSTSFHTLHLSLFGKHSM